jgi:hypothetical protein
MFRFGYTTSSKPQFVSYLKLTVHLATVNKSGYVVQLSPQSFNDTDWNLCRLQPAL